MHWNIDGSRAIEIQLKLFTVCYKAVQNYKILTQRK